MDEDDRKPQGMGNENPMEKILDQMQRDNFSHAPGEEMTHVAGVSFVDDLGLSLGAVPREEAGRAGAYRDIANCAQELEALVLEEEEDSEERLRLEREQQQQLGREGMQGGQGAEGHDDVDDDIDGYYTDYQNYHAADGGGHDPHSRTRSSTRLRGEDRHILIERNPRTNQVAAVVLKKQPEHDDSDESGDEGED
eukprot:g12310.t1